MTNLARFLDAVNKGLDIIIPICCLIFLIIYLGIYSYKQIKKHGPAQGAYLAFVLALEELLLVFAVWFFPTWFSSATNGISAEAITWIIITLTIIPLWFRWSRKHGGNRGIIAGLFVLATFYIGWLYAYWIGIIFISLPILFVGLFIIFHIAQIALPSSNPEDTIEKRSKFIALLQYLIGIQSPAWVVKDGLSHTMDMRIQGNLANLFNGPGFVWLRPYQVVGLSTGVEFNVVDGQGVVFTKKHERPIAVIDLRNQLRTSKVKAVTQNGVPVTVIVSITFTVGQSDRDPVDPDFPIDRKIGSYWYSTERIKRILGTMGVKTSIKDGDLTLNWDEWVIKQAEHVARLVVSGRDLNELWQPRLDHLHANASQEMAVQIKEVLYERLKTAGVQLLDARIIDFILTEKDGVARQHIDSWKSIWSERDNAILADADARANQEIESARAYAKSVLLDSIADSIQKATDPKNKKLSKHVIAVYFIHALETYIRKQPSDEETQKRLQTLKDFFTHNRTET